MVLRFTTALFFTFVATCAFSTPLDLNLADRYLDMSICMDRTMGKGWQRRFGIHMLTNRWGALEADESDLDTAPQAVRMTALRCRREASLTAAQVSSFGR